jgi:hypothetical protein
MTGEQIAKLIMAGNELGKARSIMADLLKDNNEFSIRLTAVVDKLKDCEAEISNIQFGK